MLKRLSRCWLPFVRRIWCSVAIAHAKELMSYFKSLVLVRKLVVSPYRCNEFSTKSTFLTRPIPTSADRPNLYLVGLDISRPVLTENLLVRIYPDRFRPRIFWSGYIPTSHDLGQNYSGLVYVEHCQTHGDAVDNPGYLGSELPPPLTPEHAALRADFQMITGLALERLYEGFNTTLEMTTSQLQGQILSLNARVSILQGQLLACHATTQHATAKTMADPLPAKKDPKRKKEKPKTNQTASNPTANNGPTYAAVASTMTLSATPALSHADTRGWTTLKVGVGKRQLHPN